MSYLQSGRRGAETRPYCPKRFEIELHRQGWVQSLRKTGMAADSGVKYRKTCTWHSFMFLEWALFSYFILFELAEKHVLLASLVLRYVAVCLCMSFDLKPIQRLTATDLLKVQASEHTSSAGVNLRLLIIGEPTFCILLMKLMLAGKYGDCQKNVVWRHCSPPERHSGLQLLILHTSNTWRNYDLFKILHLYSLRFRGFETWFPWRNYHQLMNLIFGSHNLLCLKRSRHADKMW